MVPGLRMGEMCGLRNGTTDGRRWTRMHGLGDGWDKGSKKGNHRWTQMDTGFGDR